MRVLPLVPLVLLLVFLFVSPFHAGTCPGANPNDNSPDDAALQACLDLGGTIELDPGTPGYIIAIGLNITVNGTTITSSCAPTQATIIAHPDLNYPILETNGIITNLVLEYLIVDGNKDNRATRNLVNCNGANNVNYRTTNIMLPGYIEGDIYNTWDPYRFVENVVIRYVATVNSPCGTGIGIQGRHFEIAYSNISNNGWDGFNNPQGVAFPYADGINAAVCFHGHIHDNIISDNTNMQVTAGPGPYCWVKNNVIRQTHVITQCGINCWPTNVWMTTPVWWHPGPWDLSHSSIEGNILYSTNEVTAGSYSGIAVAALPWANVTLTNTGFVFNNTISGANILLLVDGVSSGTIWGNTLLSPSNSSGKTSSWCHQPQYYTVAKSKNLFLQPGYTIYSFDLGSSCFSTGENIISTVDNAKFTSMIINGHLLPAALTGTHGSVWNVAITYTNIGTSLWQDIVGDNGHKLGDAINLAAPFWGDNRARMEHTLLYPGSEYTFKFSITLPSTPGTYQFQWQMVQELVNWFGEKTPSVSITVV